MSQSKITFYNSLSKRSHGFTLIELLVVIAIIGILASVILIALGSARAKSRDAKRIADVGRMATAFELFYNDVFSYPSSAAYTSGAKLGSAVMQATDQTGATKTMTPTYMGLIPTSPTPADNCATTGANGNDYWYTSSPTGNSYTLTFCLGAKTGVLSAGSHSLTPSGIQ